MIETDKAALENGRKAAVELLQLIDLAKKQNWLKKSWQPFTVGSFLLTFFANEYLLPFLNKNGSDISAIDLPIEAWVVGGGITGLYMLIEAAKHILDKIMMYKFHKE